MGLRLTYHNGTEQIVVTATDDRTNAKRCFLLLFFCCLVGWLFFVFVVLVFGLFPLPLLDNNLPSCHRKCPCNYHYVHS